VIARVNRIRRENPALQRTDACASTTSTTTQLIATASDRRTRQRRARVVNLDPHHAQSAGSSSTSERSARARPQPYQVHDLLTGARYLWQGARNFVAARPAAHARRTSSACAATSTTSCEGEPSRHATRPDAREAERAAARRRSRPADPLWYKDAVIYQLHVKAFFDANGDGIGDFAGLTDSEARLHPGPRRQHDLAAAVLSLAAADDGYDIADYRDVIRDYGTLRDFRASCARRTAAGCA
jgi:hypothetical protein